MVIVRFVDNMKLLEKVVRWKYKWFYSQLSEVYKQWYPPKKAVKLLIENIEHREREAKFDKELAGKLMKQYNDLKRENAKLRINLLTTEMNPVVVSKVSNSLGINLDMDLRDN
jgi:hypothetical protein